MSGESARSLRPGASVPVRVVVDDLAQHAPGRELRTLRALYSLSERVATARSHLEIHEAALDALMEAVAPDRASVLAFDAQGVMRFQAWRGLSETYRRAVDGHSPWKREETAPVAITVEDATTDASLAPYRETILGEGIRALAFVPLVHQRRLLGKFMLYHDAPHAYTSEELAAASAIAAHVAASLARWEAQAELERARQEAARLEKLSALGSLVAGVAHEVRTPLTSLVNALHVIQARARRVDDPQLHDMAGNLVEDAMRIDRLVQGLRHLTRLDASDRRVARLDVTAGEAVTIFESAHPGRRVELDLRETPPVLHDRVQLQQVVINLLDNAFAASAGAEPRVRVETRAEEGAAVLVVSDQGVGMAPDVAARMWEEFFTTKADGTGLGLSIVRRIVASHGGSIDCATAPGAGSAFTIRLPAAG